MMTYSSLWMMINQIGVIKMDQTYSKKAMKKRQLKMMSLIMKVKKVMTKKLPAILPVNL